VRSGRALTAHLLVLLVSACSGRDSVWLTGGGAEPGTGEPGAPDEATCPLGQSQAALSVVDRSLLGGPAGYSADPTLGSRERELLSSQRLRRQIAWQVAERVLAPVPLPAQLPPGAEQLSQLPTWQTWHAKDDLTRIFRRAYPELSVEQQAARAALPASVLDAAWDWNDGSLADFPEWTLERQSTYRNAIDGAAALAGLGGIYRVAYAPAASRRLLESYGPVLGCRETAQRTAQPGDTAQPGAIAAPSAGTPGDARCGLPPSPPPTCLSSAFPPSASIIKASWRRTGIGLPLPAYDTSAAALTRRLSANEQPSWEQADSEAEPGPDEIYTLRLPNGNSFRLAALHMMTKELDHWVWATLWWSPEPDTDFGADRPASLPAPWNHYKLCTVVAYDEADPDPRGGFTGEHPTLGDALEATYAGLGGRTWCSNPYLEEGDGNAASNCIGCHQHAGTGLRTESILAAPAAFPDHTRRLVREDFPADYVFGASVGDDLGAMFRETEQHYDAR
jgi:hypothetical protein